MIPDPLHPAVVHFPIVLILLGAVVAVVAVFLRRWHLPMLAAIVLVGGAGGALVATWTGEEEAEMAGEISEPADALLEEHEEWGEWTRNVAIVAALLAVGAAGVGLTRHLRVARGIGVATALVAVVAAYSVGMTGHYGGLLVYKHGVGINPTGAVPALDVHKSDEDGD
jgi:uncharacterized membrane protein